MTETEFRKRVLDGVDEQGNQIRTLGEALNHKETGIIKSVADVKAEFAEFQKLMLDFQKSQLALKNSQKPVRKGFVTDDCARFLGACALQRGLKKSAISQGTDQVEGVVKDILGKAALTTSDIPLPTEWGGEVVELVSAFGAARRFGTEFPLGAGTVKLPTLGTDTAFGLIAMSAAIGQKSPSVTFVTFNPEKWGGLIILPNELDADSVVPLGQFVARYAARQMAKIEDTVFFAADGTGTYDSLSGLQFSTITNSKVTQMASTKTHYSDATLANVRTIRSLVDAAALGTSAYYMHPSFEQFLSGLNTAGDKPYMANGIQGATLDGFPIHWVDVMPAYSTSANVSKVFMLFGDLSYQYLGIRSGIRMDTSDAPGFANDQLYIRALERFTIGLMANGAVSGLQTAAS